MRVKSATAGPDEREAFDRAVFSRLTKLFERGFQPIALVGDFNLVWQTVWKEGSKSQHAMMTKRWVDALLTGKDPTEPRLLFEGPLDHLVNGRIQTISIPYKARNKNPRRVDFLVVSKASEDLVSAAAARCRTTAKTKCTPTTCRSGFSSRSEPNCLNGICAAAQAS